MYAECQMIFTVTNYARMNTNISYNYRPKVTKKSLKISKE